jgi:hypothetical protein
MEPDKCDPEDELYAESDETTFNSFGVCAPKLDPLPIGLQCNDVASDYEGARLLTGATLMHTYN